MRPLFVHVCRRRINVLTLEHLQAMNDDLTHFQNESDKREQIVKVWTTAPGILQLALDERATAKRLLPFRLVGRLGCPV